MHINDDDSFDRMPSDDSFIRLEKICAKSPKCPRILVNNSPLDLTLNKSLFRKSCTSRTDLDSKPSAYFPEPVNSQITQKSYDVGMNDICRDLRSISLRTTKMATDASVGHLSDNDTTTSAYYSGRSSSLWKFDESSIKPGCSYIFPDLDNTESSAYHSELLCEKSSYRMHDTLDLCNYRRVGSTNAIELQEPSTPLNTGKSPTRRFEVIQENDTISPLRTSKLITSSPIEHDTNKYVEPDDLNDTLERVNYKLAVCGAKTPSPTKMTRRRELMEVYVAELLAQEAAAKARPWSSCNNLVQKSSNQWKKRTSFGQEINASNKLRKCEADDDDELFGRPLCTSPTPYNKAKRVQLLDELQVDRNPPHKPAEQAKQWSSCNNLLQKSPRNLWEKKTSFGQEINASNQLSETDESTFRRSDSDEIDRYLTAQGCTSPTPYSIAKRKQLLEELQTKQAIARRAVKRTISVDKTN